MIVEHTSGKLVWLDTQTGYYYDMPAIKRHRYDVFNSFSSFLASPAKLGIIPVFCSDVTKVKRRIKVKLHSKTDVLDFYNVERINNTWANNLIDNAIKNEAYWAIVRKHKLALNDCMIEKLILIKKTLNNGSKN